MNRLHTAALLIAAVATAGCSSAPPLEHQPPPIDIAGDAHHIAYDALRLEIDAPGNKTLSVETDGSGEAVAEGFRMMAAAPLGCLQGGMYAGLCLAMAPFFPFIAAARVERPEVVQADLRFRYGQVESYDLRRHLEAGVLRRLGEQGIPLVADEDHSDARNVVTLRLSIPPIEVEHSGYKGGSVDMTLPYIVELLDGDGNVLTRNSDKKYSYINGKVEPMALYARFDQWVDSIVEASVDKAVVEWEPRMQLDFVYPGKHEAKAFLSPRYFEWTEVDTLPPRLEWQPLAASMPASRLADITELSYEIEIFAYGPYVDNYVSTRRVIRKVSGLSEPAYAVDVELRPCQRYYWAPRARFRYRGNVRTTSVNDAYVLLTPGEKCKRQAWQLPE